MIKNYMEIKFPSRSENESFARVAVASFISQLDPTLDELTDIKTVVSEAVTNAVIHGYEGKEGIITIKTQIEGCKVTISVSDNGIGIQDIKQAKQALYTSKPYLERSGMGFTIMENFMDELKIESSPGKGTTVYMAKTLKKYSLVN